jgi:secretion/DNA translocation related TadE-like protein
VIPRGRQRGAATLLVASMAGVLLTATLGVAGGGRLVVEHRRAQAAADLAALAGATVAARGQMGQGGMPCVIAGQVAATNGAQVTSCATAGREVAVAVTIAVQLPGGYTAQVTGRARAGS